MADFSAPQGRSERPVSLVGMLIAAVMFAGCLGLIHASGLTGSASPGLYIADSGNR